MSAFSASKYLDAFVRETGDMVEGLESDINEYSAHPENSEILNELFRKAHSIKSSAALIQLDRMAALAHRLEDVLSLLRNNTLSLTDALSDGMYSTADALQSMMKTIQSGSVDIQKDGDAAFLKLEEILHTCSTESDTVSSSSVSSKKADDTAERIVFTDEESTRVIAAAAQKLRIFEVRITVHSNCQLKYARMYLVYSNLKEIGEVITARPDIEALSPDECIADTVSIVVSTDKNEQDIREACNVDEIESAHVLDITPDAAQEQIHVSSPTIHVEVNRLDVLLSHIAELVALKNKLNNYISALDASNLDKATVFDYVETVNELERVGETMQQSIMNARMMPLRQLFSRFPRMVHNLSAKMNKRIELIIEGKDTEVDRVIMEEIMSPLTHLVRNSIDHGIESPEDREHAGKNPYGTIRIRAERLTNNVVIEVKDDGRGIDLKSIKKRALAAGILDAGNEYSNEEIINCIFHPGISGAQQITETSGRGVGMDVVKKCVDDLQGRIDVVNYPGEGITFTIFLPLTLAITRVLLVDVAPITLAIPLDAIDETVRLYERDVVMREDGEYFVTRGGMVPLLRMHTVLGVGDENALQKHYVVIIKYGDERMGLTVDRLLSEQDVVIKQLENLFSNRVGLTGMSILSSGEIALILDPFELIHNVIHKGKH